MTPKYKIQPNTQNTVDGKEDKGNISPSGVNSASKTQANPEFYDLFYISMPRGFTARLQLQETK